MLHRLQGIVLRCTKYTDNSLVVNVYTREYGLQSYLTHGIHGRTSKVKTNYFRGLMVLDMLATKKGKSSLERISEIAGARCFTAEFDPVKSAIAFFINELLYKTIHEEESNPKLFDFLLYSLESLSLKKNNCANFHLTFMLKFSQYLGFYPTVNFNPENKYFDLLEGSFVQQQPNHIHFLNEKLSKELYNLIITKFKFCERVKITNAERKSILSALLDYYRLHHALISDLTSQHVLEQFN